MLERRQQHPLKYLPNEDQQWSSSQSSGDRIDKARRGLAPLTKLQATLFLIAVAFFAFAASFVIAGGAR